MHPEDDEQWTLSVPVAGAQAGLGKNASYRAARLGQIPTIRLGGKLRVPTLRWKRILQGLREEPENEVLASTDARSLQREA
jgi:hypothetical protein